VQTCIWPSWRHCHSLSLALVKSRLVLPFWYPLTRLVSDKVPLNGCVCVLFIIIFGTLSFRTQWWRQSSGKQSLTWQYCCLLSYAFNCASVRPNWRFLQSVQRFQFFIRQGLHFFTDLHSAFSQWYTLSQLHNFTAKIKHKLQCKLYVISPMSLQHNTSYITTPDDHFAEAK